MSKLINLANHSFTLETAELDNLRRRQYFRSYPNPTVKLMPEEDRILAALGIDDETKLSLRTYLAKFFEELPHCQSDASLILNQQCEVPYYIMWSTQLAAQHKLGERIKENKKTTRAMSDYQVAIDDSIIASMNPTQGQLSIYDQMFQLINIRASTPADGPTGDYDRVFQLILLANTSR